MDKSILAFIEAIPDAILIVSSNGQMLAANQIACAVLGYSHENLLGLRIEDLVPERFRKDHSKLRESFQASAQHRRMGEVKYFPARRADGSEFMAEISIGKFPDPTTDTLQLVITIIDRTEKVATEKELERLANIDPLTNLKTRRRFYELAEHELTRSRRYDNPLALIYFDVDHFKKINDTYGHYVGDYVLKQIGVTCNQAFRDNDIVGRIGGEEFAAMLPETSLVGATVVADRLRISLGEMEISTSGSTSISMAVSLGVVCFDKTDSGLDDLFKRADKALYQAKHEGRNRVCVLE